MLVCRAACCGNVAWWGMKGTPVMLQAMGRGRAGQDKAGQGRADTHTLPLLCHPALGTSWGQLGSAGSQWCGAGVCQVFVLCGGVGCLIA